MIAAASRGPRKSVGLCEITWWGHEKEQVQWISGAGKKKVAKRPSRPKLRWKPPSRSR